jgi:hypothetical protein
MVCEHLHDLLENQSGVEMVSFKRGENTRA